MRTWIPIIIIALTVPVARAQELTGTQTDAAHGITFTVPEGWVAASTPEGYIFGHTVVPGMILLSPMHHEDLAALARIFSEPTDDGTSVLHAVEGPEVGADSTVKVVQAGTMQGTPVKVVAIARLNPYHGSTANLMAFAASGEYGEALDQALMALHRSVRYAPAGAPVPRSVDAVQEDGPVDNLWKQRLSGTRLTYMDSYSSPAATEGGISGGYSVHRRIDLCPEGHFKTDASSEHTFSGEDVSAAGSGSSSGQGTWNAMHNADGNVVLRLRFNDGHTVDHRLGWEDGRTYLDGERWFRTSMANDGPAYAPDCP